MRLIGQIIDIFLSLTVNKEMARLRMSDMEWDVLDNFEVILEVFIQQYVVENY
jgi:hypothetical protein